MQFVVADHGREGLLLDGGRAKLDALKNGGVENVHAGIDTVADELDGLLNESVDTGGVVWLVDNHTVLGGFFDLCDNNGALVSVAAVELEEVGERVVANYIGVEDEER